MKRIRAGLAICMLAGAAIPVAAWAEAAYSGPIDDGHDGTVAFAVVREDGARYVTAVHVTIHVDCTTDAGDLDINPDARFRVKHGQWDATRPAGPTEIGNDGELTFAGELRKGGKARGTIKFVDPQTAVGACTSHTKDWKASKVPPG